MPPTAEAQQPDFSDGSMIALYPPVEVAETLAIPDGLPVDELHMTVAYMGHAEDVDADAMNRAVQALADRPPIEAVVAGHARFTGGDQGDVIVALIDSAAVEDLRRDLLDRLAEQKVPVPRDHGFTAHITLAYLPGDEPSPVDRLDSLPVTFAAVTAVHGSDHTDVPFTAVEAESAPHPIVCYARTAYAQGWAASGGPMTDRVRAGCLAAIDHAVEHADQPDVLEVTLKLGELEGVWADIYDRRERLHAQVDQDVRAAWRDLLTGVDLGPTVAQLRRILGLSETTDDQKRRRREAAVALLALLLRMARVEGWAVLVAVVVTALREAQVHGWQAALSLIAQQAGVDAATLNADTPTTDDAALTAAAQQILLTALGHVADDVGADLAADGYEPGDDGLEGDLADGLDGSRPLTLDIDTALSAAYTAAMAARYVMSGVQSINFLTAGDGRVCQACQDAEDGNPYSPLTFPHPPLHPGCRCIPAPA